METTNGMLIADTLKLPLLLSSPKIGRGVIVNNKKRVDVNGSRTTCFLFYATGID